MEDVEKIREMVDRFRDHCKQGGRAEDALPNELKAAFKFLERYANHAATWSGADGTSSASSCIESILRALETFCSRPKGIVARTMLVLKRGKHLQMIKQCHNDVLRVLNIFNVRPGLLSLTATGALRHGQTELQIHQLVKIHELFAAVQPHVRQPHHPLCPLDPRCILTQD
jgi:hypothetical protein